MFDKIIFWTKEVGGALKMFIIMVLIISGVAIILSLFFGVLPGLFNLYPYN